MSTQAFEWQAMACLQGHMHVLFLVHELGYACVILLCWIEGWRFPPPDMTTIQGPHRKKKKSNFLKTEIKMYLIKPSHTTFSDPKGQPSLH